MAPFTWAKAGRAETSITNASVASAAIVAARVLGNLTWVFREEKLRIEVTCMGLSAFRSELSELEEPDHTFALAFRFYNFDSRVAEDLRESLFSSAVYHFRAGRRLR